MIIASCMVFFLCMLIGCVVEAVEILFDTPMIMANRSSKRDPKYSIGSEHIFGKKSRFFGTRRAGRRETRRVMRAVGTGKGKKK